MIKITKATKEEQELIIKIANDTFKPIRPIGFDFRSCQPKVYSNPNYDFSLNHYLAKTEEDIPVATFGNLIYKTSIDDNDYSFSFLGSVSVLPEYQSQGIMKEMMNQLEKDNLDHHVVFSLLTGKRKRYQNYGYEKGPFSYAFNFVDYTIHHFKNIKEVTLEEIDARNQHEAYKLYKNQDTFKLRDPSNFYLSLKTGEATGYFLYDQNHSFIGYCSLSKAKKEIFEIMIKDMSYLPSVIKTIMISTHLETMTILVSPFQKKMIDALSLLAESISIRQDLHIKIYDIKAFLFFLYELNLKYFPLKDKEVVYRIKDETILVSIVKGKLQVTSTDRKADYQLSRQELITHLFMPLPARKEEQLYFDLSECDRF